MDQFGFSPEGFAPTIKPAASRTAGKTVRSGSAMPQAATATRGEGTLRLFQGIESAGTFPWLAEAFMALTVAPVAFLLRKAGWSMGSARLRGATQAPIRALKETSVSEFFGLRAANAREGVLIAREVNGKAAAELAPKLDAKADILTAGGNRIQEKLGAQLAPLRGQVGGLLDKAESTGAGAKVKGWLERFTQSRVRINTQKAEKRILDAVSYLENGPAGLKHLAGEIQAAGNIGNAAAKASALKGIHERAYTISKGLLGAEVKGASEAGLIIGNAAKTAKAVASHEQALLNPTLRGMAKNLARMPGRLSIFTALIGTGIAAGITAGLLGARRENKIAKEALVEMKTDLGADHPLVRQASRKQSQQGGMRYLASGLTTAPQALFLNQGMGAVAMTGAIAAPMAAPLLVGENPLLNAYKSLKEHEKGTMVLSAEQQQFNIRQLMGFGVPALKKGGDIDHKLTGPISVELMHKKLGAAETAKFIFDPVRFMDLAREVKAKEEAKAAHVPAKAANSNLASANDNGKPMPSIGHTKLQAADVAHEGRIAGHQHGRQA